MDTLILQFMQFLTMVVTWIVSVVIAAAVLFIVYKILRHFLYSATVDKGGSDRLYLLVKIPSASGHKDNAMEEFLKSLHRVLPNNSPLNLEMASNNQFLMFYLSTSRSLKNILESQLYAQYPEAEIEELDRDYLSHLDSGVAVVELTFKKSSIFPLASYRSLEEDLLKNLSAMLSKTEQDEQVYLQFCLRRVGSKWWNRGWESFRYQFFGSRGDEVAHTKLSQDLYKGVLRIAYVAQDSLTAKQKLSAITGLFKLAKGQHNELKRKRAFFFKVDTAREFKARLFANGNLWTPDELATLYHFPSQGSVVSNVVHTTSKRAPAPDVLPREGLVDTKDVSFFGETNYRNEHWRFGIKRLDRRRHMYVVGKTGSGKSRLLQLLLISDIQNGQGCCLIDPHGDLAEELLKYVPKDRINDVIYVDPSDRDFPIGFNPLEPVMDYQVRQHLSTFFIAIFKKLFSHNWNPRMEHIIRYITLALLETPDSNILGIQRLLSDTTFRQRVIKQIQDPVVKSFWINEYSSWNERFSNDAVIPILNKVGQFIANPIVRNMVGQRKNMLQFEKFMNEGKIVLVNISKGKLGDENAALLGSMFITKIQQAALARAKIPEEERRDFYFYVDEFQNFATDAFSSILSEARKYHLNITIAHQYIAQLPDDVKATAFGNVGSIITFSIGGDDAAYLVKEFAPTFTSEDMINLNIREMYIKMSIDGKLSPPFSARTINVPKPSFDFSKDIVNKSRMTYGKNRVSVENEIAKWSQSDKLDASSLESEEGNFPEPII